MPCDPAHVPGAWERLTGGVTEALDGPKPIIQVALVPGNKGLILLSCWALGPGWIWAVFHLLTCSQQKEHFSLGTWCLPCIHPG